MGIIFESIKKEAEKILEINNINDLQRISEQSKNPFLKYLIYKKLLLAPKHVGLGAAFLGMS